LVQRVPEHLPAEALVRPRTAPKEIITAPAAKSAWMRLLTSMIIGFGELMGAV